MDDSADPTQELDLDEFTSKSQKKASGRNYFFTWNNYTEKNIRDLLNWFEERQAKYVFQEEKGENAETPHLQGFVQFNNVVLKETMNKKLENHWNAFAKNNKACIRYCSKIKTAFGRRWVARITLPEKLEDELAGLELLPFQKFIKDLLDKKPDMRDIYWFWEPNGDVGKTSFIKHLIAHEKPVTMVGNSTKHSAQTIGKMIEGGRMPKIVFVNLTECTDGANYSMLEKIKDGLMHCDMYDTGLLAFNRPHVVVFANQEPFRDMNRRIITKQIGVDI